MQPWISCQVQCTVRPARLNIYLLRHYPPPLSLLYPSSTLPLSLSLSRSVPSRSPAASLPFALRSVRSIQRLLSSLPRTHLHACTKVAKRAFPRSAPRIFLPLATDVSRGTQPSRPILVFAYPRTDRGEEPGPGPCSLPPVFQTI